MPLLMVTSSVFHQFSASSFLDLTNRQYPWLSTEKVNRVFIKELSRLTMSSTIHLSIHPFIRLPIRPSIHSFIRPPTHPSDHLSGRTSVHPPTHLHPVIHSSDHSFVHSFLFLVIHPFLVIHSFIHLFIHSFIHLFIRSIVSFIYLVIHTAFETSIPLM